MHWFSADLHSKGQSRVGTFAISWLDNEHGHDNDDDDDNINDVNDVNDDYGDGEDDDGSGVLWKLG